MASGAADVYGFTTEEVALACASHNTTQLHQAIVSSMLGKIRLGERDLMCGFTSPLDEEERARITLGDARPSRITCECSGEHEGMLAACRYAGWETTDYIAGEHPVQEQIRAIVAAAWGVAPSELHVATDGCSIPTFGAPIGAFAFAYAVLADPDGAHWEGEPAWRSALHRLREAMLLHPNLISGEGEFDTSIICATDDQAAAKLGAEGLLCLAIPGKGLGVAISGAGGSSGSTGPAAVAVLEELELVNEVVIDRLRRRLCPPVETFTGHEVGATRPALQLHHP